MNLTLSEIIEKTKANLVSGDTNSIINNISIDTRTIKKGDVYLALKGDRFDGHDFINDAIDKEASGIILEENRINESSNVFIIKVKNSLTALGDIANLWRKKFNIPIIGITGSNGKTTTKEMLYSILSMENDVCATSGNLNNLVGLPLSLMKLNKNHSFGIFEMGMNAFGEITRLTNILKPTIGLITNVGAAHLEGVGSIEGVLKAKGELFDELQENDLAIINYDDERIKTLNTKALKVSYGMKIDADYSLIVQSRENKKINIEIIHQKNRSNFEVKECGDHFLMNWLSSYVISKKLGVSDEIIQKAMTNYSPPSLRGEEVYLDSGAVLIKDCYNANPDSMRASLLSMKSKFPQKRLGVILGEMNELGEDSDKLHHELGELLNEIGIEYLFSFGKKAKHYLKGFKGVNSFHYDDLNQMKEDLKNIIKKDDVVLVKGSRLNQLEKIFDWF
jgi:UDP-N-acetylmuramoyl-tripeptide--D-alanyl-D-alanine ligase